MNDRPDSFLFIASFTTCSDLDHSERVVGWLLDRCVRPASKHKLTMETFLAGASLHCRRIRLCRKRLEAHDCGDDCFPELSLASFWTGLKFRQGAHLQTKGKVRACRDAKVRYKLLLADDECFPYILCCRHKCFLKHTMHGCG